ncbi:MAG: Gfo/Idh/MocA family oxidoreductase [Fimbriimonadaceae bacterium]|nr:Gfo/Idh/MocA family oxidoreductase [Fimbriimonadaceae bacterium]
MALRVAVVGLGHIGRLHARIYQSDPLAELVGVCDLLPDRAAAAGREFSVPTFGDLPTLLAALQPDLVSVATGGFEYSSDHWQPTLQAFAAGAHVLCEKPICNDLGKAREMVDAGRRAGKCFGIDFNHRFTPAAYAAHRWLDDGLLGDLLFCNMCLWIGRPGQFESPNYHLKALNPHSVNMMTWYCGPIDAVQCFALRAPGRNLWSTASINVRFTNGAVGHLTSSYDLARAHGVERCEVAGTTARLVVDDMWKSATLYPVGTMEQRTYTNPVFGGVRDFDDTFRERLHRFLDQVSTGTPPDQIDGSGADGLFAQRVIQAAITSLDEGNRLVHLDEI